MGKNFLKTFVIHVGKQEMELQNEFIFNGKISHVLRTYRHFIIVDEEAQKAYIVKADSMKTVQEISSVKELQISNTNDIILITNKDGSHSVLDLNHAKAFSSKLSSLDNS